jgi:hypothetical protein
MWQKRDNSILNELDRKLEESIYRKIAGGKSMQPKTKTGKMHPVSFIRLYFTFKKVGSQRKTPQSGRLH